MRLFILLIVVALFALSVIALMAVGLCIGMAYLMVYFVPSLDLPATLVPAAILATTVILMLASVFTAWFTAGIRNTYPSLYGYNDEDEDEEEYEPEPPTVTRTRSYPVRKNRREQAQFMAHPKSPRKIMHTLFSHGCANPTRNE